MSLHSLLDPLRALAREAGAAILEIYSRDDHDVSHKSDNSPVTAADLAAHHCIVAGLQTMTPDVPVLSEEALVPWSERQTWTRYWLVDPLDGTREFIQRNGDFTVNIALIDQGKAVLGAVYVPVHDVLYYGGEGIGAWKESGGERKRIATSGLSPEQRTLRVVASRNHRGDALESWLAAVEKQYPDLTLVSVGSSLKICLVAEGAADVYPRLAPTSEWDIAAAHAVLDAAGGKLVDVHYQERVYNSSDNLLNPWFLALGDPTFPRFGDL